MENFAEVEMRAVAEGVGKAAKEALPDEVRPAVEAFMKGWRGKQRPPEYWPIRQLRMAEDQTKNQGLQETRAELSALQAQQAQTEQQERIPYKNGVLVPWTPEQQQSNKQWTQQQEVKEFNRMRDQWVLEEAGERLSGVQTAHLPEYRSGDPQKSPSAEAARGIGATTEEYEAIAGRMTGAFAEHVRAWGWNEAARVDRAQKGLEPRPEWTQEEIEAILHPKMTGAFAEHVRTYGVGDEARAERAELGLVPSGTGVREESAQQQDKPGETGAENTTQPTSSETMEKTD